MPFEIIPAGTNINFLGYRKVCLTLSLVVIGLGVAAVFVRGVPMGIDFVGGTELQLLFADDIAADESSLRDVAREAGFSDAEVVRFGDAGSNEYLVRFKAEPDSGGSTESADGADSAPADGLASNTRIIQLENAIRSRVGDFTEQRVEFVGPRVGAELRADGVNALFFSALAILAYVAFRFNARFAPGAVVAVVHDLGITGGLLVMAGVEFDLRILAAMLAILGYSLNDTIIIYDRIRENMEIHTTVDLESLLNTSVNQTLSRTVLTSITTILALLSLYFLGGEVIQPFAFAMLIGVLVGTYSSVFIASPLLLFLETRYGEVGERGAGAKGRSKQGGKKNKPARA